MLPKQLVQECCFSPSNVIDTLRGSKRAESRQLGRGAVASAETRSLFGFGVGGSGWFGWANPTLPMHVRVYVGSVGVAFAWSCAFVPNSVRLSKVCSRLSVPFPPFPQKLFWDIRRD